jgi:hypothetical protein
MDESGGLAAAVAAEVEAVVAELPAEQREALSLRDRAGLSHGEIAARLGLEPSAVGPLLARARLSLRERRRGAVVAGDCTERERALRALARRQDGEPLEAAEDGWLLSHLGGCEPCSAAHAAMLEASVWYRAAAP